MMDNREFKNLRVYTATMLNFKKLLENGLITIDEYCVIETKMAEKCGLLFSVLHRIINDKGLDN